MHRWVAILLLLFHGRFREFGPDLSATFDDRWRERPGWPLAVRTIADLTHTYRVRRKLQQLPANAPIERASQSPGLPT